ncbi:MAG: IS66 family transposase [Cyanobacteria bacterium P01_A01_bin.37]
MGEIEIGGEKIPDQEWEAAPERVKKALVNLAEQVKQLSERLATAEERLKQNSSNSSRPPSSDGFGAVQAKAPKQRKPRGGQKRTRQVRKLIAVEQCSQVHTVKPEDCPECGERLRGEDVHPHRHQVWELPKIEPFVVEYRLHALRCEACGTKTRAQLPSGVCALGNGERLSALVGLLSGEYRQSHAQVQRLMQEVFGVALSYGGINRLRCEISEAIAPMMEQATAYVREHPLLNSDETSFTQGNRDGQNPEGRKGWLWVLVTPLVSVFAVVLSRSQQTAKQLIGETFEGIVSSDRYGAYNWIDVNRRQICWAHLKRDLIAISQRSGVSKDIGESLLRRQQRLFRWWHRVRDGTLSRETFGQMVEHLRAGFKTELEEASCLPIGDREKTPLAKTVRTCQNILRVEAALWTFAYIPDVEPTNNAAERALRPAVIWRRTSFGSQSEAGSQFVSRMLTVSTSLKAQNRSVLEVLTQACHAARLGQKPPSLLPESEIIPGYPQVLLLPQTL